MDTAINTLRQRWRLAKQLGLETATFELDYNQVSGSNPYSYRNQRTSWRWWWEGFRMGQKRSWQTQGSQNDRA